jgi:hypothetical protein
MSKLKSMGKILLVTLTVGFIGFIDYAAAFDRVALDAVTREFYFLPILLGSIWFGAKGGLFTSLCTVYVYLPAALLGAEDPSALEWGYLLDAISFVGFALLWTLLKQVRGLSFYLRTRVSLRTRGFKPPRLLLLCLDDQKEAVQSAHALLNHLEPESRVHVTIMGVLRDPHRECFESFEAFYRAVQEEDAAIRAAISEATETLVKAGVSEDRVRSRVFRTQTSATIREILSNQQFKDYETILLGSYELKGSVIPLQGYAGKRHRLLRLIPALQQLG